MLKITKVSKNEPQTVGGGGEINFVSVLFVSFSENEALAR